jgi:hypothetical protein
MKKYFGPLAIGLNYQQFHAKVSYPNAEWGYSGGYSINGKMHGVGALLSYEHNLLIMPGNLVHTLEVSIAQNQETIYSHFLESMKMKSATYSVGPEFRFGQIGVQVGAQYSHRQTLEIQSAQLGIIDKYKYQDFGTFARLSLYI